MYSVAATGESSKEKAGLGSICIPFVSSLEVTNGQDYVV